MLDASLSMRAVEQGVPLFARAQAEAADVLRGSGVGDGSGGDPGGGDGAGAAAGVVAQSSGAARGAGEDDADVRVRGACGGAGAGGENAGGAGDDLRFQRFPKIELGAGAGNCRRGWFAGCGRWRGQGWRTWRSRRRDCRPRNR